MVKIMDDDEEDQILIPKRKFKLYHYKLEYLPLDKLTVPIPFFKETDVNVRDVQTIKKEDMGILYRSIRDNGLFVPLIVIPNPKYEDTYLIVDGQRRFLVLQELSKFYQINSVPCLIAEDMNVYEAFRLSVEESRTQVKVSTKNLESKIMQKLAEQSNLLNYIAENKRILERKRHKRK